MDGPDPGGAWGFGRGRRENQRRNLSHCSDPNYRRYRQLGSQYPTWCVRTRRRDWPKDGPRTGACVIALIRIVIVIAIAGLIVPHIWVGHQVGGGLHCLRGRRLGCTTCFVELGLKVMLNHDDTVGTNSPELVRGCWDIAGVDSIKNSCVKMPQSLDSDAMLVRLWEVERIVAD